MFINPVNISRYLFKLYFLMADVSSVSCAMLNCALFCRILLHYANFLIAVQIDTTVLLLCTRLPVNKCISSTFYTITR